MQTYHDAVCLTAFDPALYTMPITVSIGPDKKSKKWRLDSKTPHVAALIQRLSEHREGPKDGPAFVFGDIVPGERKKTAIREIHAVALDDDLDPDLSHIAERMKQAGKLAICYTTHSHLKTTTHIRRDDLERFAPSEPHDSALMRRYLAEKKNWPARLTDTVEYEGRIEHTGDGVMCVVTHKPIAKVRIVIPLETPFRVADFRTSKEAEDTWRRIVRGAAELYGVASEFDETSGDVNRLFYHPRHEPGAEHQTMLCGGELLDWRPLAQEDPLERLAPEAAKGGGGKSKTKEGKELGPWAHKYASGFQIVDAIRDHCPEKIRSEIGAKVVIECPNDGAHQNAGDQTDSACIAISAGEGTSPIFTVSCRHASCQGLTALDMFGMMLASDYGLPRDVLTDSTYYPKDEAPEPEAAERMEKHAQAKASYLHAIDALTPEDTHRPDVIEGVIKLILDAGLDDIAEASACKLMSAKLGIKQSAIDSSFKKHKLARAKEKAAKASSRDSSGRMIFPYAGEYSFPKATEFCSKRLLLENTEARLPRFTQMSGVLVRLAEQADGKSGYKKVSFVPMSARATWAQLSKRISFVKTYDGVEGEPEDVPERVANYVYEMAHDEFPDTPEIMSAPFYKSDGSLVLSEGYHFKPEIGLNHYVVLNGLDVGDVPTEPTREQMEEARDWLKLEIFSDFPFLDTDTDEKGQIRQRREPSEAHAFALFLTPFMRRMIPGHTPLFMISKPQPNVGATFLAHCAMQVVDGEADTKGLTYTKSEEELQKSLVSAILSPRTFMFYDNVREFDNRILISTLTSSQIGGRVLGGNREAYRPNNFIWLATGINPKMSAEMRRRTCDITLNPQQPSTDKREFRHKDLAAFISGNRGLAIRHLLTMIEFWQAQGSPEFTTRELSSYENWSRIVGGVLECCGVNGFLDNTQSAPPDMTQTRENEFLTAFVAKYGTVEQDANTIFEWAEDSSYRISDGRVAEDRREGFLPALLMLCGRTIEAMDRRYGFNYRQDKAKGFLFGMHEIKSAEKR